MHTRALAIAAALPLLAATACKTSSSQKGTSSQAQTSRDDRSGSTAAAPSASGAATDPMMKKGPAIMGHSDDQIVSGRLAKVSDGSVEIQSPQGEAKTLELAPQTSVKIDGQDAQQSDLQEGQQVRASFSEVDGKDVAVEIRAGQPMGSGSTNDSTPQGPGSSETGSPPSGPSSGADHTNSPNGPASPNTATPGRNY